MTLEVHTNINPSPDRLCAVGNTPRIKELLRQKIRQKMLNLVQWQSKSQNISGFKVGCLTAGTSNGQTYGAILGQLAMYEGELQGFLEGGEIVLHELAPDPTYTTQWIEETIREALGEAVRQYGSPDNPSHPDFDSGELAR